MMERNFLYCSGSSQRKIWEFTNLIYSPSIVLMKVSKLSVSYYGPNALAPPHTMLLLATRNVDLKYSLLTPIIES